MTTETAQAWRGHCGRGPCWMEDGHEGPCEPGGSNDPRRQTEKAYTPPVSTILRSEALNPPEAITEQARRGWWLAMCRIQHLIDSGVIAVITPAATTAGGRDE